MQVELVDFTGSDARVLNAVLAAPAEEPVVSEDGELSASDRERFEEVLREGDGKVFENPLGHCTLSLRIECPLSVLWEWQGRSKGFTFSLKTVAPEEVLIYIPEPGRILSGAGMTATGVAMTGSDASDLESSILVFAQMAGEFYDELIRGGVSPDLARNYLPLGTVATFYVTASLRDWLGFIALQDVPAVTYETRCLAEEVEEVVAVVFPCVHKSWVRARRGAIH